jgi:filamentous hemagglutinin family protein
MTSASSIRFQLLLSTAVAVSLALPCTAVADPLPVPTAPDPNINTLGNTQTVTLTTARTIKNWNSFDIDQSYTVNFTGATAEAVLNRVVTADVSNINGTLMSDRFIQVFLINPNGIIFGSTGVVDVGSFVASTLGITDNDFLLGDATPTQLNFSGTDVSTGVTVNGGAQLTTRQGPLALIGGFIDVKAGGVVSAATDVGFVAANSVNIPADPGSPLTYAITVQGQTPVEHGITVAGHVTGRSVVMFQENEADAQDALLLVSPSAEITATADVGGDIVLILTARTTSEGTPVDSPGRIENHGQLTASGRIYVGGGTRVSDSALILPRSIVNDGTLDAGGDVLMQARHEITNSGLITAGDDVTLSAFAFATESAPATDEQITNSGTITAGGDVRLIAGINFSDSAFVTDSAPANVKITNSGKITAGGDVTLLASIDGSGIATESGSANVEIINSGTIAGDGDVLLSALALLDVEGGGGLISAGDITNSGVISVDGMAQLRAQEDIDNRGAVGAGGDAILDAGGNILDSSGSFAGSLSGADVALSAGGSITAGTVTARDDIAIRAPGPVTTLNLTSGATIGSLGPVDVAGAADELLPGVDLSGHDVDVDGSAIAAGVIRALGTGSDIRLHAPVTASRSDLDFAAGGDITVDGPASGVDVAMDAGGTITTGDINARDDIALRAGNTLHVGTLMSGVTVGGGAPVDAAGSADALLGENLAGHDVFVDVGLGVTLGTVVAQGGDVSILADDLDISGSITGSAVSITNRAGGANTVTLLGDAVASNAFTLTQAELNSINADTLTIDSLDQNLLVGNVAFDNDAGSARINLLGTARVDVVGAIDASGVNRTLQIGGTTGAANPNDPTTLASIIRIAPTSSAGGRIILGGGSLDLRGVKIGVGLDDGFLTPLGLMAGGSPVSTDAVQRDWIANLGSTLYGIPGGYANPVVISAGTITVTYADYALFQNTGSPAAPSGVNADVLSIVSSGNDGNGFELFGTIDQVGGRGAALLVQPEAVSLANSRVNGCLIVTGGGCGGGGSTEVPPQVTTFDPTDPVFFGGGDSDESAFGGAGGEFAAQELIGTDQDQAFSFDSLVGTNNEGLLGVLGADDAKAAEDCAPEDKRDTCRVEEKPHAQ